MNKYINNNNCQHNNYNNSRKETAVINNMIIEVSYCRLCNEELGRRLISSNK